ncbi:MAG: lipid-transfer protein [Deltaproteobacteria bacterium]|nr:lipid-transfer protein [Deltaproteobacteria bacterium]
MTASKAVIAGIGQTEFSKNSGRSELQLTCEAIQLACEDAGLAPSQIDGMSTFTIDNNEDVDIVRSMGIENLRFSSRAPHGGGGSMGTIAHAMAAVEAGLSSHFICYRAMNERSEARFGIAHMEPNSNMAGSGTGFLEWSMPYGAMTPAAWTGIQAQRYMEKYGIRNEDFAPVSVQIRQNAATNPLAWFYEKPITTEEHQSSRWIVEPIFRLLDCCQESDGGVAILVTSEERARDLRQTPARISHATQAVPFETETVTNFYHEDLSVFDSGVKCAEELYGRTGLGPQDIQVGMLYDHFTIAVFWHLEAMGFCKPGEAAAFVKDGHLAPDGSIPLSPNGGLIGEAYIHGMNLVTEAVRQIRGTATNQIEDVENVLLSAGMSGAILSRC